MEYELLYLINSLGVLTVGLIVVYHFIGMCSYNKYRIEGKTRR